MINVNYAVIACQTLSDELNLAYAETRCNFPVTWVSSDYHSDPNKLRAKLQEEIDSVQNADTILFAYGLCGNGLVGLKATAADLIIPKTDDCISMVLSSPGEKYERHRQTYFLTKGWMQSHKSLLGEYNHAVLRYGEKRAKSIFAAMLKHYKHLMLIDTGAYALEEWIGQAEEIAQKSGLALVTGKGCIWMLKKLLEGPYDTDFCVIRKGETVDIGHFQ